MDKVLLAQFKERIRQAEKIALFLLPAHRDHMKKVICQLWEIEEAIKTDPGVNQKTVEAFDVTLKQLKERLHEIVEDGDF